MTQERRRQQRFSANMFADFATLDYGDVVGRGVVVDASTGGLAVETEADLPLGGNVSCHIELPFQVRVRVISQHTVGQRRRYGLQFVGMGLLDRLLLKRAIRRGLFTKKVT